MSFREDMLDWMIEVLSVFEKNSETFYLSVQLFDRYCLKRKEFIEEENLLLVGITAMFIASKIESSEHLSIYHVSNVISHGKFNHSIIVSFESHFLKTLDYSLYRYNNYY